ncbi:adenine deaminase [Candidatus Paracaedibacter symbiosus]|uniref:adenine deaminase n=1 Tax=Candidatus Paracaedibacter symbiosus TaxID=244582 RepID=UPI000509E5E2|nr:adenine deaminase [Candidatus Paracaedibacter symbiosus]
MDRFSPNREQLKEILKVARGDLEPDLVIKNVQLLDLINGDMLTTDVAIKGRWIAGIGEYKGPTLVEATGLTIIPGFIDAHTHIESSLMHPFEFEAATLPQGTLTTICDPHEIGNVLGEAGIAWFLRCAKHMQQKMLVQISSCIPSLPGFETNGGSLSLEAMNRLKESPYAFGLGEMMNLPAVVAGDDEVLDKLDLFRGRPLDGHAPTIQGKMLNAYRAAGIQNCHENVTAEEAKEKLRIGMAVMLREGSVAKNLATLAPIVNSFNSHQCLLCSDDRNPYEIYTEGHINFMVKQLIQKHKVPPHIAYRLSSYSAAQHYGLKRLGLIAPGYQADFLLMSNLENVDIHQIFVDGKPLDLQTLNTNIEKHFKASQPPIHNSINSHNLAPENLQIHLEEAGVYNVIGVIADEIITTHEKIIYSKGDFLTRKINKIAVLERYQASKQPSLGLVEGFQLVQGAFASTVAHDSHNIIAVGTEDTDMCLAMNHLKSIGGGFVVANNGKITAELALPLAGLMSLESSHSIADKLTLLKKAIRNLGCELHEPLLQLAFLALPVIPSLKITDKGRNNFV